MTTKINQMDMALVFVCFLLTNSYSFFMIMCESISRIMYNRYSCQSFFPFSSFLSFLSASFYLVVVLVVSLEFFIPTRKLIWRNLFFTWVTIEIRGVVGGFNLKKEIIKTNFYSRVRNRRIWKIC